MPCSKVQWYFKRYLRDEIMRRYYFYSVTLTLVECPIDRQTDATQEQCLAWNATRSNFQKKTF